MRDDDERALLRHVASGDQHALRCLYAAYRPRLWSYLFSQLDGDAGWAEELTQDVFLAVWRSAATYRGEAQPATWLFRIAHNLAANARRTRDRRPRGERLDAEKDGDERDDLPVAASPEDVVIDHLTLTAALARLSARHREVLDLAFVQGFSLNEVATILGVPVGTVKSRVSHARRALYTHLAGETRGSSDTACAAGAAGAVGAAGEACRDER